MNTIGLMHLVKPILNTKMKLSVDQLYLIALEIDVEPCELLKDVCKTLSLKTD